MKLNYFVSEVKLNAVLQLSILIIKSNFVQKHRKKHTTHYSFNLKDDILQANTPSTFIIL